MVTGEAGMVGVRVQQHAAMLWEIDHVTVFLMKANRTDLTALDHQMKQSIAGNKCVQVPINIGSFINRKIAFKKKHCWNRKSFMISDFSIIT